MTDFVDLLLLARLSNIAYIDEELTQRTAVEALGLQYIARYENQDHQAFIAQRASRTILAISGTRFSDGNVHELLDDQDVLPVDVGNGCRVMAGFHRGQAEMFAWALTLLAAGRLDITGHSLGGARTHLSPLFVPPERLGNLTSYAAPKAANRAYWGRMDAPLTRVVNSRDLWASWVWFGEWSQPEPMIWLHDGLAEETSEGNWPGGLRAADHSIEDGYIKALTALAADGH